MHPRTLGLFPSQQSVHRIENSEPHGLAVHVPGFQHLIGPFCGMDRCFIAVLFDEFIGGAVDVEVRGYSCGCVVIE